MRFGERKNIQIMRLSKMNISHFITNVPQLRHLSTKKVFKFGYSLFDANNNYGNISLI